MKNYKITIGAIFGVPQGSVFYEGNSDFSLDVLFIGIPLFFCLQVVKDGLTAEKASANCAELKRVQAGDLSYEEAKAAAASRARLEIDGVSAEKSQVHAKVRPPPQKKIIHSSLVCHCNVSARNLYAVIQKLMCARCSDHLPDTNGI